MLKHFLLADLTRSPEPSRPSFPTSFAYHSCASKKSNLLEKMVLVFGAKKIFRGDTIERYVFFRFLFLWRDDRKRRKEFQPKQIKMKTNYWMCLVSRAQAHVVCDENGGFFSFVFSLLSFLVLFIEV